MAMQKKEAEQTIILCVDKDDQIIGFVMRKIDGNDARFGPIGVKEELRSKGLGGVLLDLMISYGQAELHKDFMTDMDSKYLELINFIERKYNYEI